MVHYCGSIRLEAAHNPVQSRKQGWQPMNQAIKQRFIRRDEVISMTGLSAATIWRHENSGTFPARRQLGPNSVAWLESEVLAWMNTRVPVALAANDNSAHAA